MMCSTRINVKQVYLIDLNQNVGIIRSMLGK